MTIIAEQTSERGPMSAKLIPRILDRGSPHHSSTAKHCVDPSRSAFLHLCGTGRDGEYRGSVAVKLAATNAGDVRERVERGGATPCDLDKGRVVEDHIRR